MSQPAFVKNEQGLYHVVGQVSSQEIIDTAAALLWTDIAEQEALTSCTEVAKYLQMVIGDEKSEQFCVLYLNNQHQAIAFEKVFQGTINSAPVFPRVVAQKALEHNAAAVILAHNHPSGKAEPSYADKEITKQLKQALALLDIQVLDHLIITSSDWVSLASLGEI